jgi:hypothetical protein
LATISAKLCPIRFTLFAFCKIRSNRSLEIKWAIFLLNVYYKDKKMKIIIHQELRILEQLSSTGEKSATNKTSANESAKNCWMSMCSCSVVAIIWAMANLSMSCRRTNGVHSSAKGTTIISWRSDN